MVNKQTKINPNRQTNKHLTQLHNNKIIIMSTQADNLTGQLSQYNNWAPNGMANHLVNVTYHHNMLKQ